MENTSANQILATMEVPKSWKETLFHVVFSTIVIVSTFFALFDLVLLRTMPAVAVVASVLWLLFLYWQVGQACREDGSVRQFAINQVGVYARRQSAEIVRPDGGPPILCFGYSLFGRRFSYLRVRCSGIQSVDWGPGQATGLAGRDMNDWHVCLWFGKGAVAETQRSYKHGIYIVGPSRRKEDTERFGNQFIDFLCRAGVTAAQADRTALPSLIGKRGLISHLAHPIGKVIVEAHEYPAHPQGGFFEVGTEVEVRAVSGLSLMVRQIEAQPPVPESAAGPSPAS